MLIQLKDIKPSPYNPKQPLTKKQFNALKRNVEKYGFQRDLLVCKDFNSGGIGYICLDGHTAIQLLEELGKTETECKVVENVKNEKTLKEFITGYAISKKPLINEMFKELGSDLEDIFGKTTTFYDAVSKLDFTDENQDNAINQKQYFLTLPPDTIKKLKSFIKTKAFKEDKTKAICDKIENVDAEILLQGIFNTVL